MVGLSWGKTCETILPVALRKVGRPGCTRQGQTSCTDRRPLTIAKACSLPNDRARAPTFSGDDPFGGVVAAEWASSYRQRRSKRESGE